MGILIKDADMPTGSPLRVWIYPDGIVVDPDKAVYYTAMQTTEFCRDRNDFQFIEVEGETECTNVSIADVKQ